MGFTRRLVEGAFKKLDEASERADAAAVAKLSPSDRERHDAWEAHSAALRAGTPAEELGDPRLIGVVLRGPAGEVNAGLVKAPEVRDAIEEPAAWERQMLAERAARDEVRAPYLAPDRHPVRIARVATIGKTQLREVAEHLAASGLAARPDLVYGAYRVPDLISAGRLGGEKGGVVEWDVVHASDAALSRADAPGVLSFEAKDVHVVRSPGEPAPLDEDLALDVLARAGVGSEHTIGIARDVSIAKSTNRDEDSNAGIDARVRGVHLLVAPAAAAALAGAGRGGPWRIPPGPPEGICVDVLQWDAIAQVVHPVRQHRAPLPSPFPYLPLTAQELLRAYVEIVGLAPADAYSAQVTHNRPFDLMARTSKSSHVRRTGGGPDLPCADGKPRKRMAGGHHIVFAYRDRPEYEAGRARFEAYATTELKAHLRTGLGLRAPVPKPQGRLMKTIDRVGDIAELISGDAGHEDGWVAPRYCWPPRKR